MQIDNLSFWGVFLIFAGVALLVRVLFNIEFPVLRILAGLFFILLGLSIMLGNPLKWPVKTSDNEIIFRSGTIDHADIQDDQYQIIFSETTFDLAGMKHPEFRQELKLNIVFSGCTVYLPDGLPVSIKVDAVFAGVKMPARNSPLFGRGSYISDDYDADGPCLDISVNVVFGSITLMYR